MGKIRLRAKPRREMPSRHSRLAWLVAAVAVGACTPRYRYDRLDEARDNVDVRDLEDLIADSQNNEGRGPGSGLGLRKKVIDYDFSEERDEYRIGRNDVLNVYVVDHPEMSSQRVNLGEITGTTVQKDGNVYLPVIGSIRAVGLSVVDFREKLLETAAKYILDPHVSVEILDYRSQKFFVLGQVRQPGAFPVTGHITLLEGLGLAGGTLPEADLEGSYVIRNGNVLPISLAGVLLEGQVEYNVFMQDRDLVYVPDNADKKVYVLGEVQAPTVVPIQRTHITLAEALAAAGGPTAAEARKEISVLRGGFAKPVVYTVDLEQALLFDERIALRPGDRVVVAPTGLSTASKYMQQILPFLQGIQALGIAVQGATNVGTQITATQGQ